jgi:hypothetical protein
LQIVKFSKFIILIKIIGAKTMSVKSLTRNLKTDDITVMSHVTSMKVVANRISKLSATPENSTTIHLNFEVKGKKDEPCILANAEELGFILQPKDALEIGLSLIEMAMENQSPEAMVAIQERLSQLSSKSKVAMT